MFPEDGHVHLNSVFLFAFLAFITFGPPSRIVDQLVFWFANREVVLEAGADPGFFEGGGG